MIPSWVLFGRVDHDFDSSVKRSSWKFWATSWATSLLVKCSSCFVFSAFDSRVVLLPKSRVVGSIPTGRTSLFLGKTPLTSELSTPCRIVRLSISDSWRLSRCPKGSNFWATKMFWWPFWWPKSMLRITTRLGFRMPIG